MMGPYEALIAYALGAEKVNDDKDRQLYELARVVLSSPQAGTIREIPIAFVCNRTWSTTPGGYDVLDKNVEIKTKCILTEPGILGETITKNPKHNGLGKFAKWTWARHKKYLDDNVIISIGGYTNGRLLFVIDFPYVNLKEYAEEKLTKQFPDGDVVGVYLNTLDFSWLRFKDGEFRVRFVSKYIEESRAHFVKKFYDLLVDSVDRRTQSV